MDFIAILICLALIRFTQWHNTISCSRLWGERNIRLLQERLQLQDTRLLMAILLLLPWLIVTLIYYSLISRDSGLLLTLCAKSTVLWFSLGSYVLHERHTDVTPTIWFYTLHHRLFAVLIWFVLLGPCGALLYRLTMDLYTLTQETNHPLATQQTLLQRGVALLDWIPVRITLLLYALAGNFGDGIHFLLQHCFARPADNIQVLVAGAQTAFAIPNDADTPLDIEQIMHVTRLVEYAIVILVGVIGIFSCGAWVYALIYG